MNIIDSAVLFVVEANVQRSKLLSIFLPASNTYSALEKKLLTKREIVDNPRPIGEPDGTENTAQWHQSH